MRKSVIIPDNFEAIRSLILEARGRGLDLSVLSPNLPVWLMRNNIKAFVEAISLGYKITIIGPDREEVTIVERDFRHRPEMVYYAMTDAIERICNFI